MAGVSVDERTVHMDPVAGDVKGNDDLEPEHELGVEQAKRHDQAGGGTSVYIHMSITITITRVTSHFPLPVCCHVEHSSKTGL